MLYYVLVWAFLFTVLVSTVSGIHSTRREVQRLAPAAGEADGIPPWFFQVAEEHLELEEP